MALFLLCVYLVLIKMIFFVFCSRRLNIVDCPSWMARFLLEYKWSLDNLIHVYVTTKLICGFHYQFAISLYHEVISHKMCTNNAINTILGRFGPQGAPHLWNPYRLFKSAKYGLDGIISAIFMRNHLKAWQIGIEIHIWRNMIPGKYIINLSLYMLVKAVLT